MKKRLIALLLPALLIFSLSGCGNNALVDAGAKAALESILSAIPEAQGTEWECVDLSVDFGLSLSAAPDGEQAAEAGESPVSDYIWTENEDGSVSLSLSQLGLGPVEGLTLTLAKPGWDGEGGVDPMALLGGDWYGYLQITEASGMWKGFDGYVGTAWVNFSFDESGLCYMSLYLDEDEYMAIAAVLSVKGNSLSLEQGAFWESTLVKSEDWNVSVDLEDHDLLRISSTYSTPEQTEEGFTYTIALRPLGVEWPEGEELYPPTYEQYLGLLEDGTIARREPYMGISGE